jgi:hypothetical protein
MRCFLAAKSGAEAENPPPVYTKNEIYKPKKKVIYDSSTLAQRKRDGPKTHRSLDRNQQVLTKVNFAVNVQK